MSIFDENEESSPAVEIELSHPDTIAPRTDAALSSAVDHFESNEGEDSKLSDAEIASLSPLNTWDRAILYVLEFPPVLTYLILTVISFLWLITEIGGVKYYLVCIFLALGSAAFASLWGTIGTAISNRFYV